MIFTHPENLKLLESLPRAEPKRVPGFPFASTPLNGIEVRVDPAFPKSRKTGRLIWQKDPFVTYEDSDRQWGLALGFCTEEEESVFFKMPEVRSLIVELSEQMLADFERRVLESFAIPRHLVCGNSHSSYAIEMSSRQVIKAVF